MDLIQSRNGRFLEKKSNRWVCLTSKQARDKVGHALRDAAKEKKANRRKAMKRQESVLPEASCHPNLEQIDLIPYTTDIVFSCPAISEEPDFLGLPTFHEVGDCQQSRMNRSRCTSADWTKFLEMLQEESTVTDSDSSDDNCSLLCFEIEPALGLVQS